MESDNQLIPHLNEDFALLEEDVKRLKEEENGQAT